MAGNEVRRVEISSLRLGPELGSGGQGKVVAVEGYLIDGKWPAALKTYNSGTDINVHGLEEIVSFPDQLHPNDRNWLMGVSSWPWVIAMDQGVARGFLMRVVPGVYQFNFMTVTQGGMAKLSTVEFLLNPDSYVRSAGLSISERGRLNLLGTLAEAMSRLHALGVVIGDLSPKNLLFNPNAYSSCFFIDCDAVALHGESAIEQADTPEWEVPLGEVKATEASDSYKFGLLAIRLFARDQSARDAAAISALAPELGRLATMSQDQQPFNRPAPGSWVDAIQSAASAASSADMTQTSWGQPNPGSGSGYPASPGSAPRNQNQPYGAVNHPQLPYRPAPVRPPAVAKPPRSRTRGVTALALSVLGLIVLVLVIVGINATHNSTGSFSSDTSSGSSADTPSSQYSASAQPTNAGIVAMGDGVSGDSAAQQVAQIFNTYFTGINDHDYQQALSVYDPNGVIDPNNSSQVQQFSNGVSTTSDSAITLVDVEPSDGSTVQSAEVQFTSHQQAGYGPQDDPSATCTSWDVTYKLSQDSSGNYLINNVGNSSDSGC